MNIKEIASLIGVSSATVSRVINNSGYVKDETREKVERVIRENNYVPNELARSLSTKNTSSIGLIIPDIQNAYFANIIAGISEVADAHGYTIVFFETNENLEKEHQVLKIIESQQLKGIIIGSVTESDDYTKKILLNLEKKGIPVVLLDRTIGDVKLSSVVVDNVRASYEAVLKLIEEGHKRIATIKGSETSRLSVERYQGFLNAMQEQKIDVRDDYVRRGNFKIDAAYRETKKLFELEEPPTAIFSANNLTTLGCIKYLNEKKMKIGQDISIIGFDDIEILNIINYELSVVHRDEKLQGTLAMQLLLESFDKDEKVCKSVVIPHDIILRGSEKIDKKYL